MKRKAVVGGIGACAMAAVAFGNAAVADPLTRSSCWTFRNEDTGSWRTLCFSGARRATMRNRNRVINTNSWSSCEWTGEYLQKNEKVTVTFADGSGRCSNGAVSPQFSVVCSFDGESLDCQGSSVVNGKTLEVDLTFK